MLFSTWPQKLMAHWNHLLMLEEKEYWWYSSALTKQQNSHMESGTSVYSNQILSILSILSILLYNRWGPRKKTKLIQEVPTLTSMTQIDKNVILWPHRWVAMKKQTYHEWLFIHVGCRSSRLLCASVSLIYTIHVHSRKVNLRWRLH